MGQTNFDLSYSETTIRAGSHCTRCGDIAEIHLTLLTEMPQRSGSFCFRCGEALIHDLQDAHLASGHAGPLSADATHPPLTHSMSHHDDSENGIIFWEGHSWSSDGPFAGA